MLVSVIHSLVSHLLDLLNAKLFPWYANSHDGKVILPTFLLSLYGDQCRHLLQPIRFNFTSHFHSVGENTLWQRRMFNKIHFCIFKCCCVWDTLIVNLEKKLRLNQPSQTFMRFEIQFNYHNLFVSLDKQWIKDSISQLGAKIKKKKSKKEINLCNSKNVF